MRNLDGIFDFKPSLIGSLSYGLTAVGAPVDTLGFREVMALLVMGAVSGTADNQGTLNVKIQESATATGTGSHWTDVTDGDYNGTWAFTTIAVAAGTYENIVMEKQYERMGAGRKRYIRAHATVAGTDSINVRYCVSFLLGKPNDTLYISSATTHATGNVEYSRGL